MRKITTEELKEILDKHRQWLIDHDDGERANLSNVDLCNVNLYGVNLAYANMQDADLRWVDLQCANLQYANLRNADLHHADLEYANLYCADLRGSDFRDANLQCANLNSSDLRCANLRYADLRGTDLRDANLYGNDLRCVYRPWLVIAEHIGSRCSETLYFADYDNVQCGCWNDRRGGTLDEFREYINETYPIERYGLQYRCEYLGAIKMFELLREAYLEQCHKGEE